jgi:Na+-driven multidrug efflux pump
MIETGSLYLRIVGPTYGFFGGGLALYFASQGAGRVGWPMMVAVLRVIIAAGGGWFAVTIFGGSIGLFVVIAGALVIFGLGNVAAVASGAWFKAVSSQNRQRIETPHVRAIV